MYQTILSSKKVDSRVFQEINNTKTNNSKIQLFDKIKNANQVDKKCMTCRDRKQRKRDIKLVIKRDKNNKDNQLIN